MPMGILACCVEENYLHNVRRAINSLKKNVVDIKPNTMIKIRTLLETNKKLMIKNMVEEIKNSLNSMKIKKPGNNGTFYYRIDICNEYYLYYLISNDIGGNNDFIWEYQDYGWVNCKKDIIKDITKVLNNATIDELYECFEEGLDEFGKFKFNKGYKNEEYGYDYIFKVQLELYDNWESDNELLKNGKGNDSKLEDLIRI
jgi:hypothetical protein